MTTLITNLRNTLESARRIRFEPAPGNSATNVQDAVGLFGTQFMPVAPATTVVAASGNISAAAVVVQTNQSGAISLVVPDAATWATANGRYAVPLSIFDISGNASINNVTINFTGGDTASGLSSLTIATDYGGVYLRPKSGGGGWVVAN